MAETDQYLYICPEVKAKHVLKLNDQEGLDHDFY